MKSARRIPAGLIPVLGPAAASAADTPAAGGLSTMLSVVFGLALVMAAIGAAAWLARRYLPGVRAGGGPVRVVGGVHVGTRERVVIVEVRDQWLVLGVTATNVNLLHALDRPPEGVDGGMPATAPEGLVAKWLAQRERS
jgi:flagellar protein FliO/FliZ